MLISDFHEPVNIGNPHEMTIKEFARKSSATGSESTIIFQPLPQDDPKQRRPDITRAHTLLRWEPKVPLSVGIRKTIQYFRRRV